MRRHTYFCGQTGTVSLQKEGKAGRLTYFSAQIGTVSLQKEGKARRLTYFCGRSPSGRKTDAKQIPKQAAALELEHRSTTPGTLFSCRCQAATTSAGVRV